MVATPRKVALTDRSLKALKPAPAGKRATVWDALMPGMAVRVTDKGKVSFVAVRRRPGQAQPTWTVLGHYPDLTLADARAKAREALQELAAGRHPSATKVLKQRVAEQAALQQKHETFAARAGEFYVWYRETPSKRDGSERRRAADVESYVRRELEPLWGERPLIDITGDDIRRAIEGIIERGGSRPAPGDKRKSGGPYAARHTFAAARQLFKWAFQKGHIPNNPCALLEAGELHGSPQARDRRLTDAELRTVWLAAERTPYPYGPLVKLLLLTGARRDEWANASWPELDLNAGMLTVPTARMKAKVAHTIPLAETALAVLKTVPRFTAGKLLFSTHTGGRGRRADGMRPISGFSKFKGKFDETVAAVLADETGDPKAAMAPWTLHDLRRTVRTGLSTLKVPPHVAELVIGHAQQGIAKVYDLHRYDDEKRDALVSWEARLLSIVTPEQPQPSNVVPLRAEA